MSKKIPSVDEIVSLLDRVSESEAGANFLTLGRQYDLDALIPVYVEAFPRIKNWGGRMHIMFELQGRGRNNQKVLKLARAALMDRSRLVRGYACGTLAYALDMESIPDLEELLTHKDELTRGDAAAAIDSIQCKNHHYFGDRNHTGKSFWHPEGYPYKNTI